MELSTWTLLVRIMTTSIFLVSIVLDVKNVQKSYGILSLLKYLFNTNVFIMIGAWTYYAVQQDVNSPTIRIVVTLLTSIFLYYTLTKMIKLVRPFYQNAIIPTANDLVGACGEIEWMLRDDYGLIGKMTVKHNDQSLHLNFKYRCGIDEGLSNDVVISSFVEEPDGNITYVVKPIH